MSEEIKVVHSSVRAAAGRVGELVGNLTACKEDAARLHEGIMEKWKGDSKGAFEDVTLLIARFYSETIAELTQIRTDLQASTTKYAAGDSEVKKQIKES